MKPKIKKQRQKMLKNNQCNLQAVLLACLSEHATLVFRRSQKETTVTEQYLRLTSIQFSRTDIIDCNAFKKMRFAEMKDQMEKDEKEKKFSDKIFHHRLENLKRKEICHLLEDLLIEFNKVVLVEKEETGGNSGLNTHILTDNGIIHQQSFKLIADDVRKHINNALYFKKQATIPKKQLSIFLEGRYLK